MVGIGQTDRLANGFVELDWGTDFEQYKQENKWRKVSEMLYIYYFYITGNLKITSFETNSWSYLALCFIFQTEQNL
jgi:hypothetical protein